MGTDCLSCGRCVKEPERVRCIGCRERAKVYVHQLHKRRSVKTFERHSCRLCRKYKKHAAALVARWDKRGAWTTRKCWKGHVYATYGSWGTPCWKCQEKTTKAWLKTMEKKK